MTNYLRPAPDSRTVVPGSWSDVLDKQEAALNTDAAGVTSQNVNDSNSVASAVLAGKMHAVNSEFTLLPNESVAFKVRASGGTFVRSVNAGQLTVKYVESFTGLIDYLGKSRSLNGAIDNGYKAFYSKYTAPVFSDDNVILSGKAPVSTELYANDEVYIVVKNNTPSTVSDSFSAVLQSLGTFKVPYGLQAGTALTSTTQMSTYD